MAETASTLPAGVVDNPEAGHQAGVFPPFDTHTFLPQLVWLVIIFGALYWLMSRVALPRVQGILDARRARIASDLDTARTMQDQAEAAGEAYEKTLADAKANAQSLAQQTHETLHVEAEARRHTLEADLNGKLAAAEAQIADMKSRAMGNVDGIARDAARAIVQHITGTLPSDEQLAGAAGALRSR